MPFRITQLPSSDKLCRTLSWPILEQFFPRQRIEQLIETYCVQTMRARKLTVVLVVWVLICWHLYVRHSLGAVFLKLSSAQRVVLQKIREECDGREVPFLLSLGRHSQQAGDEGDLPWDVPFFHATHLPFPDHVHHLVSLQSSPRGLHRKEAHPGLDQPLDEAMILLDQVIQVFDLPEFDRFGKDSSSFELGNGLGISCVFLDVDHTRGRPASWQISASCGLFHLLLARTRLRSCTSCGVERFEEEVFGGLSVPARTEEKLQGVAFRIDGPREIPPHFLDFDVRLVHSPGIVADLEVRPTAFVDLGSRVLHPAVDSRMIDRKSSLLHHFL
jgi:Insertion element 4 transposase N-terminal